VFGLFEKGLSLTDLAGHPLSLGKEKAVAVSITEANVGFLI
jgi:hypothetical protein